MKMMDHWRKYSSGKIDALIYPACPSSWTCLVSKRSRKFLPLQNPRMFSLSGTFQKFSYLSPQFFVLKSASCSAAKFRLYVRILKFVPRKLSRLIQDGSSQAQQNLKYLSLLKEPCEKLTKSHPKGNSLKYIAPPYGHFDYRTSWQQRAKTKLSKDTAAQLTYIIRVIRFIWTQSTYYNTRERLTGLFRKLSNEIIRICSNSISLQKIFDGHVKSSVENLLQCIDCCVKWKTIYRQVTVNWFW